QTLRDNKSAVICTAPNAHCMEYFHARNLPVPCLDGDANDARRPPELPDGARYVEGDIFALPMSARFTEASRRRSVCLDIMSTGEVRVQSTFGDCCVWANAPSVETAPMT